MVPKFDNGVILICGGRNETRTAQVWEALDNGLDRWRGSETSINLIVTGACATGVDYMAETWAKARQIPYMGIPAAWKVHGNAAGPIRNELMSRLPIQVVWAFPGGNGTADMCKRAVAADIPVYQVILK